MATRTRNPKLNPVAGDVFCSPIGNRFLVHFVESGTVYGQKIGKKPIESVTLANCELVQLPIKEFRESVQYADIVVTSPFRNFRLCLNKLRLRQ